MSWLGEIDHVDDKRSAPPGASSGSASSKRTGGFVGHNLKFTYGYFDPDVDVDEDQRARYSIVYEYFPFAFMQLRAGVRANDGIPQNDAQNSDLYFLQLHAYF